MWAELQSRLALHSTRLVETPHQRGGRLTPPGVEEQLFELIDVEGGKPYQDGREAVIVWLGEERVRAKCDLPSAHNRPSSAATGAGDHVWGVGLEWPAALSDASVCVNFRNFCHRPSTFFGTPSSHRSHRRTVFACHVLAGRSDGGATVR